MNQANVTVLGFVALLFSSLSFMCSAAADTESFRLAQASGGDRVALELARRGQRLS